jgi:RES domain-containing protein
LSPLDRAKLATAPRTALSTTAVRHLSPKYDPRSGEGARLNGGRFNPPDSFPTLYLCETRPCAIAELTRLGTRQVVGVEGLLPRVLYRYELDLDQVLDLTDQQVREHIRVAMADLTGEDWSLCQAIGTDAHAAGDQAIRTYSATDVDTVLVVFPELLGSGLVNVELVERWDTASDLAHHE